MGEAKRRGSFEERKAATPKKELRWKGTVESHSEKPVLHPLTALIRRIQNVPFRPRRRR